MTTTEITFSEHPVYAAQKSKWETYRDLFEGDHDVLISGKYLWYHELELSEEVPEGANEAVGVKIRRIRAQRSRYMNMTEPVVSNLISMAFSKPFEPDDKVKELLGDAIDNIDGEGMSLVNFITEKIAVAYFRDGQPIVLVDAGTNTAETRGKEVENGFRPFVELLDVLSVPDWQFATTGNKAQYKSLRHEYEVIEERNNLREVPKAVKYCKEYSVGKVEVFTKNDKEEWKFKEDIIPTAPVGVWKEVPISTIRANESWIKDVSEPQMVLFNLMSAHFNQLNTQAFQRIFVAGLDNKSSIAISEYAVSGIPLAAVPHVIEPSSCEALLSAIGLTQDWIAKVAFNRTRSLAADSKESPSDDTIAEMNVELIKLLKVALEQIETLVNQMLRHFAMFKYGPEKGATFDGKVTFSKDIDTKAVSQRLEMFAIYRDEIRKVLEWRKAELKRGRRRDGVHRGRDEEDH